MFFAYGMAGLARGQTALLNVVTVGVQNEMLMELSFLDIEGRTLSRSVEKVVPGRAVFLDLISPPCRRQFLTLWLTAFPFARWSE